MKRERLKILIIRFSSIGDIVLTSPVVRCLKEQLVDVELHFLTKKAFAPALAGNHHIDKLHFLKDSLASSIKELKSEKFDQIIDLHHNLRTFLIKMRLGVPSSSFNKLNWKKWLLVTFKKDLLPPTHIVDRYMETVGFLGVKNDYKGLEYFLTDNHDIRLLLPASHQEYIGVVIGAQHATKRLPTEKLTELCRSIKQPIVLLGGSDDEQRGEEIMHAAGKHVFNGCGKFQLDQSAYLIKMSKRVVTHDTGLMHIAAAFNKPILSVWGNTVPEFGMFPYLVEESYQFEVTGLPCRPCSKIGFEKCPLEHFRCMNNIDLTNISKLANA